MPLNGITAVSRVLDWSFFRKYIRESHALASPESFTRVRRSPTVRRVLTRRFPYRIFFIVRTDAIVVFATFTQLDIIEFGSIERNTSSSHYLRRRISRPAAIARMASAVLTVVETRMLSSGKSPVRINQMARRIMPRFLPARVLDIAIYSHSSLTLTYSLNLNPVTSILIFARASVSLMPSRVMLTGRVLFGARSDTLAGTTTTALCFTGLPS
jgi:hypothetical protein